MNFVLGFIYEGFKETDISYNFFKYIMDNIVSGNQSNVQKNETIVENYLKNIIIIADKDKPSEFPNSLFSSLNSELDKAKIKVNNVISKVIEKSGNEEWIKCKNEFFEKININGQKTTCFKALSELIDKEINSTAFMLRVLSGSIIDITSNKKKDEWVDGKYPLKFNYNGPDGPLSNNWEEDSKYFKLEKNEHLVRLHIGLEDPKDLIEDLKRSLKFIK